MKPPSGERARRPDRPARLPAPALLGVLTLVLGGVACSDDAAVPVSNPRAISVESPFAYPIELWDEGEEGQAVVMVHVTETGAVDSAYVLESSGRAAFDSAAVQGTRNLKFAPGRRGDRRVAMWARLPVRFNRPDSASTGAKP